MDLAQIAIIGPVVLVVVLAACGLAWLARH